MIVALFCLLVASFLQIQVPHIAVIDFYGVRKAPTSRLWQALGVKEGDPLPPSKADVEERLEKVEGVVQANIEAVCCENRGAILFVGIEERGAPHFDVRTPPDSPVTLPEEMADAYRHFLSSFEKSARKGERREDLTHGHALSADPEVRAYQERFAGLAEANYAKLREVLRNSSEADQRAMAAYLIGYAPDKQAAVNDLQYALQDPDGGVRRNAVRSLTAIGVFASRNAGSGIRISPTWLIEMLNSLLWDDRTRAAALLVTLTDKRDPEVLAQIRDRAWPALLEMAHWNSLAYALPAYVLVGRIAGLSEQEIQDSWSKGQREEVLAKIKQNQ